ncbi:MAG: Ppx/GppA family phosphatase [Sulfurospirillaceae bacterium]|jgi:exopolyphosphatase/guanosine-5'-triphosphate,3'-diphosphate pyrophosphatase|nr:Ppx/GppA family phosphatase [Sulfurospirillaceae bacterium]MCK9545484.1 Ppx/GppA family phosphatase [Sulfurospirillaceae bacterium]MDY0237421.1 Ppx/GppA phosphatase family protein [Campylobacterales bacterium]NLM99240.1 Ppx/GppA family phosphatase [Campylobacteraceae bacterium]
MAKLTAVIDLGTNSVRLAVYEKTSRYGFHLLKEIKSRVRIGEGAYESGGRLQEAPIQRAITILKEFSFLCKNIKCYKIFCIATSALRDAPNKKEFINKVKKESGLKIKIIDGNEEALLGATGAINLLPPIKEATTIDIGGGSTELSKIIDGKIVKTLSLDIGTIRLKELFFDQDKPKVELDAFLNENIGDIEDFKSPLLITIGGTLRAISSFIMEKEEYPLKTVHGFEYEIKSHKDFLNKIPTLTPEDLKLIGFKKDRFDTVREGGLIFNSIVSKLEIKRVLTSGAGVREGVFLKDLLKTSNGVFPQNFNPSLKSLIDRFAISKKDDLHTAKCASMLFDALQSLHKMDSSFKKELEIAGKLHDVGRNLNFYQSRLHGFYFVLNSLNFGYTHKEKALIALLVKTHHSKLPTEAELTLFEELLPDKDTVLWLSFILAFAKSLNIDYSRQKMEFCYKNHTLYIKNSSSTVLAKEAVKKLIKPASFAIAFR